MTQALEYHEANICPSCGGWLPDCSGDNPLIECAVSTVVCKGTRAVEQWRSVNEKPEPGTQLRVEWFDKSKDSRTAREREIDDIREMLARHGQPIPDM